MTIDIILIRKTTLLCVSALMRFIIQENLNGQSSQMLCRGKGMDLCFSLTSNQRESSPAESVFSFGKLSL